ncbi:MULTISPECIES: AMP-binding protein [unclassified Synechococcus]|uniref:AMP-binding protein n=1 Tax=unclassified Synechococcus TaxID=2626047 RepID=UPI0000699330|nr:MULTISPECIES: AMP-binding protein [unclassified Synechococcus]EAQ76087.1 putative long-chain-fatty-acid--CoA ligase [Synechococcus sp. WH 5701]WFN58801.1 AMP-binding protein [Synechococcus sp. CCFWC 502]
MDGKASILWSGDRLDEQALAQRDDWRGLQGLEGLWPILAQRHGEAIALDAPHAHPPEQLSYRELDDRIQRASAAFASLGLGEGEVVALFAENSPRWLVADQGIMRCGAADAVRGSGAPLEELRYILDDSGAVGLVVESAALLERLAQEPGALGGLRFVVVLEDRAPSGNGTPPSPVPRQLSWEAFEALGCSQDAAAPPLPSGGPERLATLLYTSGTTGRPKGVPLSQANLLHQLRTLGVAVAPRPADRVLSVLPIWHAYERTAEYFLLSCGCRQSYTTLKHLRPDLQRVRPQYMISVPRLWEALLAGFEDALEAMPPSRQGLIRQALRLSRWHGQSRRRALDLTLESESLPGRLAAGLGWLLSWPGHGLASVLLWPKVRQQLSGGALRTAISGGGALALHVDGFFEAIGIELLVGYGLTETSPVLACRRPWRNRRGSAGQPLPETELRIVDPDSGAALGWRQRGRVLARGPQVMAGYFGKPEATAAVLDAAGWFDTGDLGHLLADGTLVLTGRAKDTIVLSSGENIEPGPLEEALVAHPLVEQVMLVGQDRRQLAALVVPRPEPLAAFARARELPVPGTTADPADRALLKALSGEFNRLLAARPGSRPDERLAGVALVEPFSIENGLLTQTLKQRRDRITVRDEAAIEGIYQA